jgi:exportin-5
MEAFSKFVAVSPDVLVPLLTASFECMACIPLEASGQLPPPAKVSLRWKEEAMARLSLAKVGLYY